MRVLEENLLLQLPNMDRREWIRRMYQNVKNYKLRIGQQMKANIKHLVTERARMEDEILEIDFEALENLEYPLPSEVMETKSVML